MSSVKSWVVGLLLMSSVLAASEALGQKTGYVQAVPAVVAVRPSLDLSSEAQGVLNWVQRSGDNERLPFLLVDKRSAALHVFDASGALQRSSQVLLGLARGDHSVPGIGERPLSKIAPDERTTPAGRFLSEPGKNLQGTDIVWIDYDAAVSLHRIRASSPAERREERLASPTPEDNRISYGCVNVEPIFYDRWVAPTLGKGPGVVYVLPETRTAASLFGFVVAVDTGLTTPTENE